MSKLDSIEAKSLAAKFSVPLGRNFFTLTSFEVGCVLDGADARKYRKPKNANGSRGRYFYEYLNRTARQA